MTRHLLMVLVSGYALGGAVEFQDGVDASFREPLGDCGLLGVDGEFAPVFVAAEFALDGHATPTLSGQLGMNGRIVHS
jgi:hypothetical protein